MSLHTAIPSSERKTDPRERGSRRVLSTQLMTIEIEAGGWESFGFAFGALGVWKNDGQARTMRRASFARSGNPELLFLPDLELIGSE